MPDSSHQQRAVFCGEKTRFRLHVAWVAALVLVLFLLFQDVFPGTPWLEDGASQVARYRNVLSWWPYGSGSQQMARNSRLEKNDTRTALSGASTEKAAGQKRTRGVPSGKPSRTLCFEVCNGYANQRLSLVYGILYANLTNRAVVLPRFILNGEQKTNDNILGGPSVPFGELYDTAAFSEGVARHAGVEVVSAAEAPESSQYVTFQLGEDRQRLLDQLMQLDAAHVELDCTFGKVPVETVKSMESVVWGVLGSLKLNPGLEAVKNAAMSRLASSGGRSASKQKRKGGASSAGYNVLHLRMENDWLAHCGRWEGLRDGISRANCLTNTWTVHEALQIKAVDPAVPLYVATYWDDVDPAKGAAVLSLMEEAGYKVFFKKDIFEGLGVNKLAREQSALLDYYLALEADKFIGNSVSSFSAMLLFEREHVSKWAAYYNGGNVPLATVLPLHKLPWVFTYNSWSQKYDYMLKAAVRSAAHVGGLTSYCVFAGDESAEIYRFLVENRVKVIKHDPLWSDALAGIANQNGENRMASHLFASKEMLVGTFLRIDVPIVKELEQYEYVLFTDADVFFRRRPDADGFLSVPLPPVIGMAYEDGLFPYNAGVMLMNLPALRKTYDAFLKFILSNEHGLNFPGYGPVDQGAYNQFYEADVRPWRLPQTWNAKPYHVGDPEALIVHFHGAKPHDYSHYLATGRCPFAQLPGMCESALKNGYCGYIDEWAEHHRSGDLSDPRFRPTCSLELRILRKIGREVPWDR